MSRMNFGNEVVRAISLKSLLAKHALAAADICLIKMDIEGGEEEVLPALLAQLPQDNIPLPPLYLSLHGPNFTRPDAIDAIAAALFHRFCGLRHLYRSVFTRILGMHCF